MDVHLDNSKSFWFEGTNNLLVQGSQFESNNSLNTGDASQYGPIYVAGNFNVSFLKNTITYHFGRLHMGNNANLLMQGNTIIRDAQNKDLDDGTAVESGGVELSFGQNNQVLNNTIQTLNAPPDEAGDGEAIMTQQSVVQNVLDAGTITAITSTTLTDADALWGSVTSSRLAQYPEVVAILTGRGTGEWRTIQGINTAAKTLTLNQAWNPVPEVGSLYSVFTWTFMNATIEGNTLINNPNGIVLYDGCYNCTIQNNILTNSRGIILRTIDKLLSPSLYPEGRRVHEVAIDNKVLNNTVSNTSNLRPAYIALDTEAFAANSYSGMGMINIEVGGNTINPYSVSPNLIYTPGATELTQEGFFPCFLFGPAAVKDPVTIVFQNVSFWNNSQSVAVAYKPNFLAYTTRACTHVPSLGPVPPTGLHAGVD
jgi:parallel beta-helix repeat protein